MTAEPDLLPLPDVKLDGFTTHDMADYAHANIAHATAAKDAEIEALRAEVGKLRKRDAEWNRTAGEAAAALEAAREDAWIACSDRLPERDGLGAVLAFDAARPRKGVWLETTHPSWWGQFMEDANEWGPTVTHWRPLPTPPAIDQARGKAGGEVEGG